MPIFAISSKKVQVLWGYWTNLDYICAQCSYNIAIEYFWIGTAIFLPVLGCQPAEWRSFCQFCL